MGGVFRSVGKDARIELANFITRSVSFFSLFSFYSPSFLGNIFFFFSSSSSLFRFVSNDGG